MKFLSMSRTFQPIVLFFKVILGPVMLSVWPINLNIFGCRLSLKKIKSKHGTYKMIFIRNYLLKSYYKLFLMTNCPLLPIRTPYRHNYSLPKRDHVYLKYRYKYISTGFHVSTFRTYIFKGCKTWKMKEFLHLIIDFKSASLNRWLISFTWPYWWRNKYFNLN